MPFLDQNIASGLPKGSRFQAGRSNADRDVAIEPGVLIPWPSDPEASYLYYDCTVGVMLDSGIAVHSRLPQVDRGFDTLASADLDDPNIDKITGFGVNLRCLDQYEDITQRMAHARYWFRLWGQALRVGYKVPIPSIKKIGGRVAIPHDQNPQWAFNRIAPGGSYGGAPLWYAQWSLWYTTIEPPVNNDIPSVDLSAHTNGSNIPQGGIQAPLSQADDNAVASGPNDGDVGRSPTIRRR